MRSYHHLLRLFDLDTVRHEANQLAPNLQTRRSRSRYSRFEADLGDAPRGDRAMQGIGLTGESAMAFALVARIPGKMAEGVATKLENEKSGPVISLVCYI